MFNVRGGEGGRLSGSLGPISIFMKAFPENVRFRGKWRTYQKRVLDELAEHLEDNHLHVIAAPGSGKTILGLEVMRRLNQPTLILAPTIAIRDQWEDRFLHLFTEGDTDIKNHISKSIRNPNFITISTYQGLFAAYGGQKESEDENDEIETDVELEDELKEDIPPPKINGKELIDLLKNKNIKTLIVDEAHHLRSEWWKCLIDVKESLGSVTIISLTATPPYDVNPMEWERYKSLCGPVDAEISVPELVKEKNLCPHQDYVYFSIPETTESKEIKGFREGIENFSKDLFSSPAFINIIRKHPAVIDPNRHIEKILDDPAFYSSMAVVLSFFTNEPPKKLASVLGIPKSKIPEFDLEFLEILLTGCLYSHSEDFLESEEYFKEIGKNLRRLGSIERRKVKLKSNSKISKTLVSSISKLKSIVEIVQLESENLKDSLRLVILTDYIRKSDLPSETGDDKDIKNIGVVPIFEIIRREKIQTAKLGILSGSFVVIPTSAKEVLLQEAERLNISSSHLKIKPLAHDDSFYEVDILGEHKQKVVKLITHIFNQGAITVLVGTKSLLGEGWDAPSINTLILASFVGSYMLSNQMRGRAMRVQPGVPNKTANVWHLVCIEPADYKSCEDFSLMERRFKAFVGVSNKESIIENGIGRLDIGKPPYFKKTIEAMNKKMNETALDRDGLRTKWETILSSGSSHSRMVEEVRSNKSFLPRTFVFINSIKGLFLQGIVWGGYAFTQSGDAVSQMRFRYGYYVDLFFPLLTWAFIVGAIVSLPFCLKALWLFLKHGPVASSLKQIGESLLRALINAGLIKTPLNKMGVTTHNLEQGAVSCSLVGGTTYEKSLFLDALQEIMGPIDNPRYLLLRKTWFKGLVRRDYHVVPEELARKKKYAEYFKKMWAKYVGPTKLIYTRTKTGRHLLLKARNYALANSFQKRSERAKIWR